MNKGQMSTLIGSLMMFLMVMIFAFFIFLLFAQSDHSVTMDSETQINYMIGEQRIRSSMDVALVDQVWKAPKTPRDKFENITGYQLASYYFTDPGNDIYIDGEKISGQNAEDNLTHYFEYKMNKTWIETQGKETGYYLRFSGPDNNVVNIQTLGYTPTGQSKITTSIPISDGRKMDMVFWVDTSNTVYGVY